jgi:predicted Zn-dependent protease with MMP-like domain
MDRSSFEHIVQTALRRLPRRFKSKIKNISIEVEDEPSSELLKDMGIVHGTLYGLYQGVPLTERGWNYGNMLPDRIVIYQRPIERSARSMTEIEQIVLDTMMHEIGHYFGFDDEALDTIAKDKAKKKTR